MAYIHKNFQSPTHRLILKSQAKGKIKFGILKWNSTDVVRIQT